MNKEIHEIITSSILKEDRILVKNTKSDYKQTDLYTSKQISELNHAWSESFYTKEYMTTLSDVLGHPDDFKKKTNYERKLIQASVLSLSLDDFSLKSYLHGSVNKAAGFEKLFTTEFETFSSNLNTLRNQKFSSQRGYKNKGSYKYTQFVVRVKNLLATEKLDLNILDNFSEEDAEYIFDSYLTSKVLFNKILAIFVKIARDRMFYTNENELFEHKSLYVFSHEATHQILDHLAVVSFVDAIVHKITSKKLVKPIDQVTRSARIAIATYSKEFNALSETKFLKDYFKSIIHCFVKSGILTNEENIKEGNKTLKKYFLPVKLVNELGKYTVPPRIAKPEKITDDELVHYIIPSLSTSVKIVSSSDLIKSINISNGKRFAINESYLYIIEKIDSLNSIDINSPISSHLEISNMETYKDDLFRKSDKMQLRLVDFLQKKLTSENLILDTPFQYRHVANVSVAEARLSARYHEITLQLSDLVLRRKAGLTRIELAKILRGFPLYFTNKL